MSDVPTPPPFPPTRPPGALPPPTASAGSWGLPGPAAYPAASRAQMSETKGLQTASTVLFWCTAAAAALMTLAAVNRKAVFDDFRDDGRSLGDVDDADGLIGVSVLLLIALAVATLIVVSIWSLRTVRNARDQGVMRVSPGWACGGWYIPIAGFFVPFIQLRRVAASRRRSTTLITVWQLLLIATWVCSTVFRGLGGFDLDDSADDVSNALSVQIGATLAATIVLVAEAIIAARAMRDVDAT